MTSKTTSRPPTWDSSPRKSESFCLSILEAMCFACPSVATEVGGIPEVIENDVTGILVPFGDTGRARPCGRGFDQGTGTPGRAGTRGAGSCPGPLFCRRHRAALRSALPPHLRVNDPGVMPGSPAT